MPDDPLLTRRLFLVGGAAAVGAIAVGCGGDDDVDAGTTTTAGAAEPATRTVESLTGPVELPVDPQRVLVTYDDALDHALSLGLPVVAAPGERGSADADFASYLPAELTAGITKITTYPEANLEEIARIAPDCIVDDYGAEFAATVEDIAPTFSYDPFTDGWRAGFRDLAAAFGLTDEAEAILADLASRAEGIRERIADELGPLKAMQAYVIDGLYVAEDDNGAFALMDQDLGFLPADIVAVAGGGDALSEESYGDIDADVIVLFTDPTSGGEAAAEELTSSPLWPAGATVVAVGIGHAFSGPFSVASYYDAIESALLG